MARDKGKLQIAAEYLAARAVLGALGSLPLAASMKIGAALANTAAPVFKRLNFVGRRNLELALPELSKERREEILAGAFESLGRQMAFVSHFPEFTAEKTLDFIDVDGIEHIHRAKAEGRGVIFFSAHFGGWEASHLIFPALGLNWNVLVRRIDNAPLESYVERLRARLGSRTIDKRDSARRIFRLLQAGEILGIVADLNSQEREGVFVDFFGIPASTTTGLARFALRTGAAVVPGCFIWQPERRKYLLKLMPPLDVPKTEDDETNIKLLTQAATAEIEKMIRAHPEQWMWIHKRWNTQPQGEPNLYDRDFEVRNSKFKIQNPSEAESQT